MPVIRPIEVRRLPDQRKLRIEWSDGHHSEYDWRELRGWCPCALCQGHAGERRFVEGAPDDLEGIDLVGNYALNLRWPGHTTGIYTYEYLRELCPCCRRQ